jgi:hypothetical protein
MQLAAAPVAVVAVPLEPVAQLLLAARLVLVEQEIIKVVLHQVAVHQVAVVLLRQRILRQRQLHRQYQNHRLNHQVKFRIVIRLVAKERHTTTHLRAIITVTKGILAVFVTVQGQHVVRTTVNRRPSFFFFFFDWHIKVPFSISDLAWVRTPLL